jgi:hypothetical protein
MNTIRSLVNICKDSTLEMKGKLLLYLIQQHVTEYEGMKVHIALCILDFSTTQSHFTLRHTAMVLTGKEDGWVSEPIHLL